MSREWASSNPARSTDDALAEEASVRLPPPPAPFFAALAPGPRLDVVRGLRAELVGAAVEDGSEGVAA